MSRTVHMLCGDFSDLAKGFALSSNDIVPLRDCLATGPLCEFTDRRGILSPDARALLRVLQDDSAPLPRLRAALHRLLWRYPDLRSGVNRQDAQLLSNTRDYGPAAVSVIGRSIAALERVGDVLLWWRLRRLAGPALPHPAVTMTGVQSEISRTDVHLTPVGERIARGELNFVELNGIDDWVGGVHLDSRVNDVWFHRDGLLIRG